ncbi:hypothetical protein N7463_009822 [Penicillium fimorum]|uniref:Uncharacterized protein n=1 Tax=Penicillium fimorum TaxID=1882269 RepID=A0A9X0C144_9EURO|nr:hypothetical protein N7463_009822 [Penicillium fimorum]
MSISGLTLLEGMSILRWQSNGYGISSMAHPLNPNILRFPTRVKLSRGPLIIPFHLFFPRNPQTPREADVIIDNEWLQKIAEWRWDMQF